MASTEVPRFNEFFAAAYKHMFKAMQEMSDDPRAKALPRDVMLTALATACIRTCALTIVPSEISMADVEYLGSLLGEEVKLMRQKAAGRGLIKRRQ